jgi:cell wall-associated NlpC family hydrolase
MFMSIEGTHPLEGEPIFTEATFSLWSILVELVTHSHITHGAVYVGDGRIVEAIIGEGVRESALPARYHHYSLNLTDDERAKIVAWAKSQVGQPYSMLQFFAAAFTRLGVLRRLFKVKGFICISFVADALRQVQKSLPRELRRWMRTAVTTPVEAAKAFQA